MIFRMRAETPFPNRLKKPYIKKQKNLIKTSLFPFCSLEKRVNHSIIYPYTNNLINQGR